MKIWLRRRVARLIDRIFGTDWAHLPREELDQILEAKAHYTPPEHPTPSGRKVTESQILTAFKLGQVKRDQQEQANNPFVQQQPAISQIWYDPTVRSYPQPPTIPNPHGRYFLTHRPQPVRENTEPIDPAKDFPDWLRGMPISAKDMTPEQLERVPTIRDLTQDIDPLDTRESPAIVALLHQERQQRRNAG